MGDKKAEKEALWSELPPDEFTPQEAALRQALLDVLAWRPTFPLFEWIDRRLGGEIQSGFDENNLGEISLQGEGHKEKTSAEKDGGGADAVPDNTPAGADAFWSSLPTDSFSAEEEALREAIFDFLASWKSQALANLADLEKDKSVQGIRRKLIPAEVTLAEWLEKRIGGEVELRKSGKDGPPTILLTPAARPIVTAKYNAMMESAAGKPGRPAAPPPPRDKPPPPPDKGGKGGGAASRGAQGQSGPGSKDSFFSSLPADELSREEAELRQTLLDWLKEFPRKRGNAGKNPSITECGQDPEVQRRRQALLPSFVPMREWIDRRVGGEIELRKDNAGVWEVLLRGQKPPPRAPARKEAPAPSAQEPKEPPRAPGEAVEAFFKGLPADELTPEELTLRQAVTAFLDLHANDRSPPTLSDASKDHLVSEARTAFLPPEVTLRLWLDRRIGGEVEVTRDAKTNAFIIKYRSGAGDGAGKANEEPVSKDKFFAELPGDSFTQDEERLRDALLTFLESWKESEAPTLSHAGGNSEVRQSRARVLPKGVQVSLKDWIDRRMGGEIETMTDSSGQLRFGKRGEFDRGSADRGTKRKADDSRGNARSKGGERTGKGRARGGAGTFSR